MMEATTSSIIIWLHTSTHNTSRIHRRVVDCTGYTHLNGCLCMRETDYFSLAIGWLLRTVIRVRVKTLSSAWSFGFQAG